ncbi:MAG: ribonuclease P protein component 4 [Candidatus Woesearchaeota archaeon]
MRKKNKTKKQKEIVLSRINRLFEEAENIFKEDKNLAKRYVYIARRLSMKYKVKIPRELKRRFCKNCYSYLKPGINCRVRLGDKRVIYYCLECKHYMRFPYIREIKLKRTQKTKKKVK